MRLKRIKIDRRKNNVAPIQTCLHVEQNVIAVGGKETDVGEVMQRGILVANPVHQSDKLLDIARPVPARILIAYFSEFRYSSVPATASFSHIAYYG
jgi:hypothetical protein